MTEAMTHVLYLHALKTAKNDAERWKLEYHYWGPDPVWPDSPCTASYMRFPNGHHYLIAGPVSDPKTPN